MQSSGAGHMLGKLESDQFYTQTVQCKENTKTINDAIEVVWHYTINRGM